VTGFSHSSSSGSSSGNSSSGSSNDNLLMAASLSVPGLTETLDTLPSDTPAGAHVAGQQLLDGHNIETREDVGNEGGGRVGVGGGEGEGGKADFSQQHAWYPVLGPSVSPAGHARLLQCSPLHTLLSAYSPDKIWNSTIPCSEGVGREVVYPAMLIVTRESML
jgi:hypothetical protein